MKWLRDRLSYANVMATSAVFLALGGGAYALSAGSAPVRGGGKIASNALTQAPASPFQTIAKIGGIGKINVRCNAGAQSSDWEFSSARRNVVMVTTDTAGNGFPDPNASGRIAGHHHGFSQSFGGGLSTDFKAGQVFSQLTAGGRVATMTLSALNQGASGPVDLPDKCVFQAQVVRQP
jgi:hypothetical protein